MSKTTTVTINGTAHEVESGVMLIEALAAAGVELPTLCHDDRLTPYGGCRLCVVERSDGRGGLIPACSTPVLPGMVVESETSAVSDARRHQLRLLVLDHRMECPVCERRGDCRLQDLVYRYCQPEEHLPFVMERRASDMSSRSIVRDPEKCIVCGKCVRLCEEVQGVSEIGLVDRGLGARVATFDERPLDCEFCGQCVNACPVGALVARPYTSDVPVWVRSETTTTCGLCSCGCQVDIQSASGAVVDVKGTPQALPNRGKLCARAWLGTDIVSDGERLTAPMVRRDGRLVECSVDEALDVISGALAGSSPSGRPAVGVASSRLTCEDALLFTKLLEAFDCGPPSLGCDGGVRAITEGLGSIYPRPRSTASLEDLGTADLVVVLRADPGRTHPLVKTELVQRVRQQGLPLALACAFPAGLKRHATMFAEVDPGQDEALIFGLAHLLTEHIVARDDGTVVGLDRWLQSLQAWTPDIVEDLTGVAPETLADLAREIAGADKVTFVIPTGLGIPGDEVGCVRAAASLDRALGHRSGLLVLAEKANAQGSIDLGLRPLTMDRAEGHEPCSVLYVVGQDPLRNWPRSLAPEQLFDRAKLVVVQDAFMTRSARQADVVLPASILMERAGTLVGADGVRRRTEAAIRPPDGVLSDGQWLRNVAARAGVDMPNPSIVEGLVHRAVTEVGPGSGPLPPCVPPLPKDSQAGPRLDSSPDLFMSGTVTGHSKRLRELSPATVVRLSPAHAAKLKVEVGHTVRLQIGDHELLAVAKIDDKIGDDVVAMPWSCLGEGSMHLLAHDGEVATVKVGRS